MINDMDFNLLVVFDAIWLERSLTQASKRLFKTQPAVSHSLKKLREVFNDPLFVKSSAGVTPTDFAVKLAPQIQAVLKQANALLPSSREYNAEKESRKISMAIGDYFAMTLLPEFHSKIQQMSPQAPLVAKTLTEMFPAEELERGKIDLVISGFFASAPAPKGFHKKIVLTEPFTCVCKKNHPLAPAKGRQLKSYLKANHTFVSPIGDIHGFIDDDLAKVRKRRKVTTVIPGFAEAGPLLERTDLVLTAPDGISQVLTQSHKLSCYTLPVQIRPYRACVLWHERTHHDPFLRKVREVLFEVFGSR